VTELERLAVLIRKKTAVENEIAAIIGRPALLGHVAELVQPAERRFRESTLGFRCTRPAELASLRSMWASTSLPDELTAERLLTEFRLAVAPGEGFGSRGAGWARLSLAVSDETLETGLERLARAIA
jgi:aspartate/methionine/tyrosine aminotransferase